MSYEVDKARPVDGLEKDEGVDRFQQVRPLVFFSIVFSLRSFFSESQIHFVLIDRFLSCFQSIVAIFILDYDFAPSCMYVKRCSLKKTLSK